MQELEYIFKEGFGKGLRATEFNPRNNQALVTCEGVFPEFGVLHPVEEFTQTDLTGITTAYPYPQVFTLSERIIACTATAIFQLENGSWASKISGLTEGVTWSVADYGDYIVLCNGSHIITINLETGLFVDFTGLSIPSGSSICSSESQLIVGASAVNIDNLWNFTTTSVIINWLHRIIHVNLPGNSIW